MNIHSEVPPTADKAHAILAAALELFEERGFHGTAVPLVAARAKVSAGTIYHYFASKEALVNVLYRQVKTAIAQKIFTGFPADQPPREQVRVVWRMMAEFALSHRREFSFMELHHHRSYLDRESLALEAQLTDFALLRIKKAQAEKAVRAGDPEVLLAFSNGAFIGLFRAGMEKRIKLTLDAFMAAERSVWEGLRA